MEITIEQMIKDLYKYTGEDFSGKSFFDIVEMWELLVITREEYEEIDNEIACGRAAEKKEKEITK